MSFGRAGRNKYTCTTISVRLLPAELAKLDALLEFVPHGRGGFRRESRGEGLRRLIREAADGKTVERPTPSYQRPQDEQPDPRQVTLDQAIARAKKKAARRRSA